MRDGWIQQYMDMLNRNKKEKKQKICFSTSILGDVLEWRDMCYLFCEWSVISVLRIKGNVIHERPTYCIIAFWHASMLNEIFTIHIKLGWRFKMLDTVRTKLSIF